MATIGLLGLAAWLGITLYPAGEPASLRPAPLARAPHPHSEASAPIPGMFPPSPAGMPVRMSQMARRTAPEALASPEINRAGGASITSVAMRAAAPVPAMPPIRLDPPRKLDATPMYSVAGIRMVEIPAKQLRKLGIQVDDLGVLAHWRDEPNDFMCRFMVNGLQIANDGDRIGDLETSPLSPLVVTDDRGNMRALMYNDASTDSILSAMMKLELGGGLGATQSQIEQAMAIMQSDAKKKMDAGKLVPILVRTGRPYTVQDSLASYHRPDCIFWYEPTAALLEILPEDVRKQVELELLQVDRLIGNSVEPPMSIQDSAHMDSEAQSAGVVPGTPHYVDLVRSVSGAVVSSAILPNPARERTVLRFRLGHPRMVSVALHDITGQHVRDIAASREQGAGDVTMPIDVSNLSGGVYLVVISTDKGEQAVQRLVVDH